MQLLLARCVEPNLRASPNLAIAPRLRANDKLDLAQAEAVADLIDAATASAARSVVRFPAGRVLEGNPYLVDRLTELRALTETTLDFPDEEIDFLESVDVRPDGKPAPAA